MCDSMLLTASGSTFGWWMAYLLAEEKQSNVYYNIQASKDMTFGKDVYDYDSYLPEWNRLRLLANGTVVPEPRWRHQIIQDEGPEKPAIVEPEEIEDPMAGEDKKEGGQGENNDGQGEDKDGQGENGKGENKEGGQGENKEGGQRENGQGNKNKNAPETLSKMDTTTTLLLNATILMPN